MFVYFHIQYILIECSSYVIDKYAEIYWLWIEEILYQLIGGLFHYL